MISKKIIPALLLLAPASLFAANSAQATINVTAQVIAPIKITAGTLAFPVLFPGLVVKQKVETAAKITGEPSSTINVSLSAPAGRLVNKADSSATIAIKYNINNAPGSYQTTLDKDGKVSVPISTYIPFGGLVPLDTKVGMYSTTVIVTATNV